MKNFKLFLLTLVLFLFSNTIVSASTNIDAVLSVPGTKYIGHEFDVDVRVNTAGNPIDTISVRNLNFDPLKLQYVNTTIYTIFSSQTTLINTGGVGYRRVDIGKLPMTPNYSNTTHVAFVRFRFLAINTGGGPTGTTTITFDFDSTPSTTGIFIGGNKILNSVTNLTINLAEDNTPPIISNCTPPAMATNVPVTTTVSCDVQDFETGIHLPGTTFTVNGITYTNSGINTYSVTPIANGYKLTVTPVNQLPYYTNIPVSLVTQDNAYDNGPILARNSTTLPTYTFLTEDDNDPPEIYSLNPTNLAINVPTSTNILFNIRDIANPGNYPGTGVDLSTLQVTVSAPGWGSVTYTQGGPNTFSFTPINAPWNYAISINPATDFPQNTVVTVNVIASDFDTFPPAPNTLNTTYSFTTLDSTPPTCTVISPTPGTTNNSVNTSVQLNCIDTGVGIDITKMLVEVNNVVYQSSGANTFSFSGTPNNYIITVNPSTPFSTNYAFEVVALGEDFSGNKMPILSYGLATGTTSVICPSCPVCNNNQINSSTSNVSSPANCPVLLEEDLSVNDNIFIKEIITQVPFRTTENELANMQLLKINNYNVKFSGLKVETYEINSNKIRFSGTGLQYSNITLMIESTPILITTIADVNGNWDVEIQNILTPGKHKLYGIARNEKTGEVVQKQLIAILDNVWEPEQSWFPWILILIVAIVSSYLGYRYGKKDSYKEEDTAPYSR